MLWALTLPKNDEKIIFQMQVRNISEWSISITASVQKIHYLKMRNKLKLIDYDTEMVFLY